MGSGHGCRQPVAQNALRTSARQLAGVRILSRPPYQQDNSECGAGRQPVFGASNREAWRQERVGVAPAGFLNKSSMNLSLLSHEWLVVALGLGLLLADLWLPATVR